MTYISQLKLVFLNREPNGTFLFENELKAKSKANDLAEANFPYMVIKDDIVSQVRIEDGADWHETPLVKGYMLTKYDSEGNQQTFDNLTLTKHDNVVWIMKQLAADVIARFFIEYQTDIPNNVVRLTTERPTIRVQDVYDQFYQGLHGVYFEFNVKFQRVIDYEPNT